MLIEFTGVVVGVVTAVLVSVPTIVVCCIWNWFAARKVASLMRDRDDLQAFAASVSNRCSYLESQLQQPKIEDEEDEFPSH